MVLRDYELFHGVALAKLLGKEPGKSVRILQMNPEEGWSALSLDGAATFVIKHRAHPRKVRRKDGGQRWSFGFNPEQLSRLRRLRARRPVHLALVCGRGKQRASHLEVCLLYPGDIDKLLDTSSFLPQWLAVTARPNKELWVSRGRVQLKIPRRRPERWKTGGGDS